MNKPGRKSGDEDRKLKNSKLIGFLLMQYYATNNNFELKHKVTLQFEIRNYCMEPAYNISFYSQIFFFIYEFPLNL